jgi:BirA family transcriptional regulator, biotin operon repressor / biotin---[acetyl-CoA-carboxylase] ligase
MAFSPTNRRVDRLIRLLVENAMVVVPGPKIAAEIGARPDAVWNWVERLRSHGVEIQGHPWTGYQLRRLPDLLAPSLVAEELGDQPIGKKILHYFALDSTNTTAMALAGEGAPHGTVVVAEEQFKGRGRFGRAWYSERSSGIYASIILRPQVPPSAAPILTLMGGLAAHQAVVAATGLVPDIRWPNDILLGSKKVGGILTEMSAETDRVHAVVLGVGLNVNHTKVPAELKTVATSLRIEGGRVYSRVRVLAALLNQVQGLYQVLLSEGSAAIARRWAAVSSFASGRRVRVAWREGEHRATTLGLDPNGALRVRFDDGREESLLSAEVTEIK